MVLLAHDVYHRISSQLLEDYRIEEAKSESASLRGRSTQQSTDSHL